MGLSESFWTCITDHDFMPLLVMYSHVFSCGGPLRSGRRAALLLPLATVACAGFSREVQPQSSRVAVTAATIDTKQLEQLIDSAMASGMVAEHIPGAAFVLVRDGRIVLAKGYGFADREASRRVEPDSTVWPFASITKVITATAVVQLADRGKLDLDANVNRYLRALQVPATYAQPVTTAQLLTHTAGFDELRGRLTESASDIRPLAEFLRGKLIRIRPPGTMTSYSSFGMALAGVVVEDVSGVSYDEYLRRNIFMPLGMRSARIMSHAGTQAGLAAGYEYGDSAVRRVPYEWYHSTPSSSFASTATDMARFMIAQLEGGAFNGKRIVSQRAMRDMQTQHATMHALIPGWGFGWQIRDSNGQRVLEHGGDIGGFSSLVTLLPDARTGFLIVGHREGANLRFDVKQAVLDRYFPDIRTLVMPKPDSSKAARLAGFAGTYRANVYCHSCPDSLQRTQDFVVTANADGTLGAFDTRWIEVAPLFFRDSTAKRRFGLAADSTGRITALTVGSWQVLERIR